MSALTTRKFVPGYDPLRFRIGEGGIKEFHMNTPEEMREEANG
jgi:hypothetical protein